MATWECGCGISSFFTEPYDQNVRASLRAKAAAAREAKLRLQKDSACSEESAAAAEAVVAAEVSDSGDGIDAPPPLGRTRASGDFALTPTVKAELAELTACSGNDKEFQYSSKKKSGKKKRHADDYERLNLTTAGGVFMVSACGLFLGWPSQMLNRACPSRHLLRPQHG